MIVGVLILIVALAIYEGFGWAGGIIMGPIETFGLLANTLSYLRVMAVGVAGVKIAEIGNNVGFASMTDAFAAGITSRSTLFPYLDRRPSLCHYLVSFHHQFTQPVSTLWNGWASFTTAQAGSFPRLVANLSTLRGKHSPLDIKWR